ncbi:MAG: proline--tRNA ligase, partial [Mycoplasmataceae bacterium]|nr:proline--tRNA ligase [Mycoplasmataceae bacterium]
EMTKVLETYDVEEVAFPLLFPESLLKKEKDHVSGFAPEVLLIERIGHKKFKDPLVIRPTSETLFGVYFKQTLNSYKQLPVKLNQWVNILRWENNTRPFLRNSEFYWQEGHTIHGEITEAKDFSLKIISFYKQFVNEMLLLPVIYGEKTSSERFAGAINTYTIETVLKDGQALQSGTSHYLGNNFTKAFDVRVLGKNNQMFNPYQTSWGISTRLIGALIMTHSDNKGLILPSKISPYHFVILTVNADKNPQVKKLATELKIKFSKFRSKIDDSDKGIGFKAQEWETKGIPIRIEIGPKDLIKKQVTIIIRTDDKKQFVLISKLNEKFIENLLTTNDQKIYQEAKKLKEQKIKEVTNIEDLIDVVDNGFFAKGYWIEDSQFEKKLKTKNGITVRCLVEQKNEGTCLSTGKKTLTIAYFARAY